MNEVVIVGGGPSLRGFDWNRLRGHHTIVTNYAIFNVPEADYFCTMDRTFFEKIPVWRTEEFDRHPCVKVFVNNLPSQPDVESRRFNLIVRSDCAGGIGRDFGDFRHGMNSGYSAVQLAVLLGFTRIRLLGIDLCDGHYHNAYQLNENCMAEYTRLFLNAVGDLTSKWPEVQLISHSPVSILNNVIRYEPWGLYA